MRVILSYFKKHIPAVLALVIALCLQVKFELLLPEYTSNIVNIGIQQGGIEDSVPSIVDENTYATLLSLSKTEYKTKIAQSYELWSPSSNDKKNIEIQKNNRNSELVQKNNYKENYYLLKEDANRVELERYMMDSFVRLASYISKNPKIAGSEEFLKLNVSENSPDFIKKQIGIKMVESIYKKNGIDVSSMQKGYLWKTGFKMLAISLIAVLFSVFVNFIAAIISARVSKDARVDSYKKVLKFSNLEMDKFSIASLISRTTNDIQQVQQSSVLVLKFLFYGPIMAIGAFVKVLELDISTVWIIALAVIMTIMSIAVIMMKALPKFKIIQTVVDKLNLVTREFISGIEVNRVFGTSAYEEKRFDKVNDELTSINLFIGRVMSALEPTMIFIMNGAMLLIIWVGAKYIEAGSLQVGDMMALMQYSMQIIMSFLFISMISILLPRAVVSANRIGEVIKSDISIKDEGSVSKFEEEGSLVFKNVYFRYDGAQNNVIEDINFSLKKGETLAIIGSTGSGKSTIVNLIPRFLEISSGSILLDNVDIREIPMKILREKISLVTQNAVIFSGTIASNIEYGKSIPNINRMKNAADISQLSDFIESQKDKFDSTVEQGGANLSGGQKQRVSIARALSRNAEIIIFDDSFSALDSKTDRKLRSEMKKKLLDKSLIIVAQRINTIMDADQIIVLDDGKIVGKGRHKDLIKTCDTYYEIAKSQLTEEELANEIKK
ncbi:ABC transporter ATP-binding protein [Peptostreptococcus faecalis]|uniref:ABC transporter ATP-binding protein n=1 Tax=Peptostreptococcus faecalis TaxID=2045015 RepID=UPI000C7B8EEA|nr:ABC transporter ATP-binding protein [Peptostreptococcus faecalis]